MTIVPDECVILGVSKAPLDAQATSREAERVGLPSPQIFYNIVNPWFRHIPRMAYCSRFLMDPRRLSCHMGHLHIVKSAYERGVPWLCVLEDDCCFASDVRSVQAALESAPDNADFLLLDAMPTRQSWPLTDTGRRGWQRIQGRMDWRASGAYVLNRKAMERYISLLEGHGAVRLPLAPDVGRNSDVLKVEVYGHVLPLAIQKPPCDLAQERASSPWARYIEHWNELWGSVGGSLSDYGVPQPAEQDQLSS